MENAAAGSFLVSTGLAGRPLAALGLEEKIRLTLKSKARIFQVKKFNLAVFASCERARPTGGAAGNTRFRIGKNRGERGSNRGENREKYF